MTTPAAPSARNLGSRTLILGMTAGNLCGALVMFFYGNFIDLAGRQEWTDRSGFLTGYFVVGFGLIAAAGVVIGRRLTVPLADPTRSLDDPAARRRALALPWLMAALSATGRLLAALIWGVVLPVITAELSWPRFLQSLVDTVIGGIVTAVITFFVVEHSWRRLPAFFPRGDLSRVGGVPRLGVRLRVLAVFPLVGLVPLGLMALLTSTRAHLMRDADRGAAAADRVPPRGRRCGGRGPRGIRVAHLTTEASGDLLVSGDTVRRLKEPFALEALPAVRVKGRSADVEVYRAA